MDWMRVLTVVLPVLAVVALGRLFRSKGLVNVAGIGALKTFVVNITLPAVLFAAFWKSSFGRTNLVCAAVLFGACTLGLGLGTLMKRLFPRCDALLPFLCTGFEAGMLGYSLYILLFGEAAVYQFAMLDVGHTLFVFTVYVGLLNARSGKPLKATLGALATSPVLIAMLLGVLFGATGLGARLAQTPAGDLVTALFSFVAAPTACVILFVIGAQTELSAAAIRSVIPSLLIRLAVTAALCAASIFAIGRLVPMTHELKFALLLFFSLPAPFILPFYAAGEAEQARVSTALSLNTFLSIAAFAVISLFA